MRNTIYPLLALICINACKKKDSCPTPELYNAIPEFYAPAAEADYGKQNPEFKLIANNSNQIEDPQDLDFHPTRANELWVINKSTENLGGTTVTISNAGSDNQNFDFRKDGNAWHFMSLPSAMAFSNNGNWATTANVQDANHGGGTFTGPTLWSSDMNIYARPSGGNGSHLDMLHGTPFGMGIASEKDNVFWVFDSYYQHIVRYDFVQDHGPGNDDHDDGKVHRYTEVKVTRHQSGLPAHLILDQDKKWLYIVDNGNNRILRMNIQTGSKKGDIPLINEMLAEHWEMAGVTWEIFLKGSDVGLSLPCGIDINGNRLFISDNATGEIHCFDVNTKALLGKINTGRQGIIGIKVKDNRLWFVNAESNEVFRVDPR